MVELLNTQNPTILPGQRLLSVKGGYEAAEKYPTPRDCDVAIFDEEDDYVYIKRTDTNGGVTTTIQNKLDNANQTQTILGNLGRFVAWAGSGTLSATASA